MRTLLLLGLWFAVGSGCSREGSPSRPVVLPQWDALEIRWLRPSPGAALADTIRAEVSITGPMPQALRLQANGTPVVTRSGPPWKLCWLPPDTVATSLQLRAIVVIGGTDTVRTDPVEVWWHPNRPPHLQFLNGDEIAAVNRLSGDSLRVVAIDPEDGLLDGTQITWFSSIQGLVGFGTRVPVAALTAGLHRLRVRASDRWLRNSSEETVLDIFDYSGGATPEGLIDDLRYALGSRDWETYERLLAADFLFLFCLSDRSIDPSIPIVWHREEEVGFIRRLLADPVPGRLSVSWDVGSIQPADLHGRSFVKVELERIDIILSRESAESVEVIGGRARVLLTREEGGDHWRVEQWQDLGGETETSQGLLRMMISRFAEP
jgi:hypothetical protein